MVPYELPERLYFFKRPSEYSLFLGCGRVVDGPRVGAGKRKMLYLFDDYRLDTGRRELFRGDEPVPVEPQVFDLLVYLIRNRERVVSKDDLLASIWGGRIVSESVLDTRIGSARFAVGDTGREQRLIKTLPRKGVRFVGAVREEPEAAVAPRSPGLADKPPIAVLPFTNMSGDPDQEYFADGMAEDITTALSKVRWLFVVSRHSAFTYKAKALDVKQVAVELGARYVLEGSVRKVGNRVRITAQLLDAVTGHHVWAERYDRELTDIFAVQDEITEQVVAAIEPQLYAAEGIRAKRKPPESLDAWECVVRALSLMNSRARPDVAAARALLRKAIALDQGYAQAHSLFSFVTTLGVHLGWEAREPTLRIASDAALRALQLDSDEPWAHVALGYVLAWSRRARDAVVEYEKALTLNPNFAIAHWLLALALCYLGRSEEALAHGDEAARLSPRDLLARGNAGVSNNVRALACFVGGRYREGIRFARNAIIESPNLIPAYRMLILNCALAGEIEEARAALQTLKGLVPDISLAWVKEMTTPYVRTEDQQRYIEGFRLAGLE
jgi:TolB-like protein/Tfp pilus assembly protein PilF